MARSGPLIGWWWAGSFTLLLWTAAAAAADELPDAHYVRLLLADQRPPCAPDPALPMVPNDPSSLVSGGRTRCYGTRPPVLELRLPLDAYVWFEQHSPNPVTWIALGPLLVDAQALEPASPPLGLRLSRDGGDVVLETRSGPAASLTPLAAGAWQQVDAVDGSRLWVMLPAEPD